MFRVCLSFLSVHCRLVVTCWERTGLLALLFCYLCFMFVMLSCLFVTALWSPAGKGLASWLSCFIIYVSCLSCFLVCSLQPCGHQLEKGWPLGSLVYVMFYCVFVIFPCSVLGQTWYLIVSLPDLCLLTYFVSISEQVSLSMTWSQTSKIGFL